mmetsp:Transcript_89851/g.124025  ORF Transcript_89851/g.124025 Transcript_89851/m.124025 type:complete len:84 (+) Transcript_89851:2055-2306(+)
MEGRERFTSETEETYFCLQYERTPQQWLKNCYPSFSSLSLFLENLNTRVDFINGLVNDENRENQKDFWLPGFFDQRGFLTMLL